MKVDWETFPQYRSAVESAAENQPWRHHLPLAPAVAYVMGGFDEARKQFPGEREMFQLKRILREAMDAGAMGWSAQRLVPESRVSVQRDYDGTPMITDILPDDFYLGGFLPIPAKTIIPVHMHPAPDGAAIGAPAMTNFHRLVSSAGALSYGVVVNPGSAVMMPESF